MNCQGHFWCPSSNGVRESNHCYWPCIQDALCSSWQCEDSIWCLTFHNGWQCLQLFNFDDERRCVRFILFKGYILFIINFIADYRHELAAQAAEVAKSQSKHSVNKGLFSSASPAMTSDISPSCGTLKLSLRPLDIGAFLIYLCFIIC